VVGDPDSDGTIRPVAHLTDHLAHVPATSRHLTDTVRRERELTRLLVTGARNTRIDRHEDVADTIATLEASWAGTPTPRRRT
jgi:hypothetical protein